MRTFCTEGPVYPEKNYVVSRTRLLEIGMQKVDDWRYFTLFAPRQSGKSTYFILLTEKLRREKPGIFPIWISFEHYDSPPVSDFLAYFQKQLMDEAQCQVTTAVSFMSLPDFFRDISISIQKDLVLVIDEVEGLKNPEILNAFLHTLRSIYHKKNRYRLCSVILVGVSNITGILQDTASPFNIADQILVPYFTAEETRDLLLQHTGETGQAFEPEVIQAIHDNAAGQPGLVNALARDLVERRCPDEPIITLAAFHKTLDAFLRVYVDKNIANVVNKAKQYPEIMKQILFDGPVNYTAYNDRIAYLQVNGVIVDDQGVCAIPVPIYKKCLYQTFKPLLNSNGEVRYFKDPFVDEAVFLDTEGNLDMELLIDRYAGYIRQRGNIIFSGEKASEGIYHYNLDAYLTSYASVFGGWVFPEVPEGGGRVDLLVMQGSKRWIIEVKRFLTVRRFEHGKKQLATYLKRSGLMQGYYVVFSDVHSEESKDRTVIDGLEIISWILPVKTQIPSA